MEIGAQIARAFWFAVVCGIGMLIWHYLTESSSASTQTRWQLLCDAFMSRYTIQADDQADDQADEKNDVSPEERNDETPESSATMPKEEGSARFQFPDTFAALAALVEAGKLTESDALRLGVGVAAGGSARYKHARKLLTEAQTALEPSRFAPLTQKQIDKRQELGLPINK